MIYIFQRMLGRGGLGEVWAATHTPSKTDVAVKVLQSPTNSLAHEVQAAASLNHPNVVRVLDFATADTPMGPVPTGCSYLVMERIEGGTLQDLC
ncbi:MAG: serine/threonine protein kinase, partial [Kiritimatiellia bacterium]